MLLTCPCHRSEFLTKYDLGVEAHIGKSEHLEDWERYIPFVHGVHLPYAHLNLAAFDDTLRQSSIDKIKESIDIGSKFPVDRMVMHTMGIETWGEGILGCYERMIDGMREVADYAQTLGITICIENSAHHIPQRIIYGVSAEEWYNIQRDVNRPNVLLTLDTSHAAAAAAFIKKDGTAQDRFDYLYEFLKYPELIGWVHWSDSLLTNNESYMNDFHLPVGAGDLPVDFHKKINSLSLVKTLERRNPEEDVIKELEFIESL